MNDVNAAFHTEKTDQLTALRAQRDAGIAAQSNRVAWLEGEVSAGRMELIGPDRYRVTQGWDRGEVFTVSRTAGQIEVVAQHGLDTTLGRAALYTSTPAWHGLGNVIPGGTGDIDTVLDLGGIGFRVRKRPVQYRWARDRHTMADRYVTIREDTGEALGVVGSRYQLFQQREIFGFLTDLVGTEDVIFESAGALRGGRRVFITMQIPQSVVIDRGGLDDKIILFIVVINSHDGTSQAEAVVTPWRVVCGNTERLAVDGASYRWGIRHTVGGLDRLNEARRTLGLTVKYGRAFEAEENALVRTNLVIDEFHELINSLWPLDEDASKTKRTIHTKRSDRLDAMFRAETERAGRTAYAAERTITDYLDHVAPRRPGKTMTQEIARATALIEGTDDAIKSKAHRKLLLLRR